MYLPREIRARRVVGLQHRHQIRFLVHTLFPLQATLRATTRASFWSGCSDSVCPRCNCIDLFARVRQISVFFLSSSSLCRELESRAKRKYTLASVNHRIRNCEDLSYNLQSAICCFLTFFEQFKYRLSNRVLDRWTGWEIFWHITECSSVASFSQISSTIGIENQFVFYLQRPQISTRRYNKINKIPETNNGVGKLSCKVWNDVSHVKTRNY